MLEIVIVMVRIVIALVLNKNCLRCSREVSEKKEYPVRRKNNHEYRNMNKKKRNWIEASLCRPG